MAASSPSELLLNGLADVVGDRDEAGSNLFIGSRRRDHTFDGANARGRIVLGERPLDTRDALEARAHTAVSLELTAADATHNHRNRTTGVVLGDGDSDAVLADELAALDDLDGAISRRLESLNGSSSRSGGETIERRVALVHRFDVALAFGHLHAHAFFREAEHGLGAEPGDDGESGADKESLIGADAEAELGGGGSEQEPTDDTGGD